MTGNKKSLGVFVIILIYIAVAIAGFFIVYFIKNAVNKPSPFTNLPKVTPVPAPSGYTMYENKDQKIALSYPSDLKKKETSYGLGVNAVELRSSDNTDPNYAPNVQMLTVPKTLAKAAGQDFDSYYDLADNTTKTIQSPIGKDSAEMFTKIRNREVNRLRALDYKSVPSPNKENVEAEIGTFIEAGDNLIIISTSESDQEKLDKMLKSFTYPL